MSAIYNPGTTITARTHTHIRAFLKISDSSISTYSLKCYETLITNTTALFSINFRIFWSRVAFRRRYRNGPANKKKYREGLSHRHEEKTKKRRKTGVGLPWMRCYLELWRLIISITYSVCVSRISDWFFFSSRLGWIILCIMLRLIAKGPRDVEEASVGNRKRAVYYRRRVYYFNCSVEKSVTTSFQITLICGRNSR